MNKIILMGRLTRTPEIRYSQEAAEQIVIARFSLAVDRRWKREGEPNADFFNCIAFGKQAEFVEKYLKQGTKVVITGRVQNNNYTNKEGQKVYSVQVMVEEMEFAESKGAAERQQNTNLGQQDTNAGQQERLPPSYTGDGFMSIPEGAEEELPFN